MLERWFGAKRWLWNTALEIRSAAYRECGLRLTGNDLSRWLTLWKRTTGHEWLANIPATCLTQCLRDQDRAFANFFAKRAKYPRFRRRGTLRSLRFQDVGSPWSRGALRLPKLGRVKLAEALPETARPDMVTLWRDGAGRYFVSFAVEVDSAPLASTGRSIGVDLGLTHLATLSTGEKVENPRRYHARLRYLRQQQRALSRKAKGSRRRARQRVRLARAIHDAAFSEFRRQLGPRDGGDLRADGEGPCPGAAPAQVSPREARSGPLTSECLEHD